MATRDMPWVPANMTPERRQRLEAFSRYRRISRQEAAGLLIDAGIEAMRPVVSAELAERHSIVRARLLEIKTLLGEHEKPAPYSLRFERALEEPEKFCISGRCEDTNWGGHDRLHSRGSTCPPFDRAEIEGYLARARG